MAKPSIFYKCILLWFCILINCLTANADETIKSDGDTELNSFLHKIAEKASIVESFICSFEQRRHLSIFSKTILFNGMLSIDRPDKLRWEVTKPIPSIMLLDGKKGRHCSGNKPPRDFNTVSDPIMKIVTKQLWSWLSGDYLALRKNYNISLTDNSGIILEPKEPNVANIVSSIVVEFDNNTLQPNNVIINEAGEDRTEIFFSEYILNKSFKADHFTQCTSL